MTRNKSVNQKMKDDRREQIMAQALHLFATRGLAATRIADIASVGRFSLGLIYHYYPSKEAIFTELIQEAFRKLNQACRALEQMSLSPLEKIRLAITELLKGLERSPDAAWYYMLIAQATVLETIPAEARMVMEQERGLPYEVLTRIFRAGQQDGSFRHFPADQMALMFWTSINGLSIYKAMHFHEFKAPDPEILLSMFIRSGK